MSKKEGIDYYTETDFDVPCPRCDNLSWVKGQAVLDDRLQDIWVCRACGYPRKRSDHVSSVLVELHKREPVSLKDRLLNFWRKLWVR